MKDSGRIYIMDNSEREIAKRVDHMVSTDGTGFVDSEAKAANRERITLSIDAD
jgi:hypothetical protein